MAGPDARFVEVQIRSERMNEIAERGFAAHWKYKGVSNQPDVYEQWFDSARDIPDDRNSDTVQSLSLIHIVGSRHTDRCRSLCVATLATLSPT